jgi:ubiquinone/menaquinone biosynthesis C-methylase UbiE
MRVLDAGCGPGRITIPLAETVGKDGEVIALDIQTEMLAKLQERAQAAGLNNISIIQAGLGEDILDLGPLDMAVMVTVLGEIPNQRMAIQQIRGWLKPGGILSITEVLPDPHYQRASTVRSLADQAGFEVEMPYQSAQAYTMHLIKPIL